MAKIFGFSTDRIKLAFEAMTDREKVMTVGFVAALALILLGGGIYWAYSQSSARREEIASAHKTIAEIQKLLPRYQAARKRNDAILQSVEQNRTVLMQTVPDSARKLGLEALGLQGVDDRAGGATANAKDTLKSERVKFTIGKLSIDKLTAFLREFEGENRDGVRKIMQLNVASDGQSPDLLNVGMVAATWKKK